MQFLVTLTGEDWSEHKMVRVPDHMLSDCHSLEQVVETAVEYIQTSEKKEVLSISTV